MPITPAVIEAANAFRARLLQRERQAATAMVRYYGTSWTRIHADIMALSREVQAMQAQGLEPSREDIISLERMRNIEAQVERELDRFAEFADGEITARQREAIATGERDAYQLMQLSLPGEHSVRIDMFRMPREAVENYVGMMQDGTPLRGILTKYVEDAAQALSETLVTGMVAGWNPRKVAREVRNAYGMALSDAMRLARTEQLRAYRTANLQSYQANSDIVTSWKRMSARLANSCIACIMLDGKVYSLNEPMDDHPNGKCFMVPQTKTYAELGIDAPEPTFNPGTGREWFEGQTPAMQRGIMGSGMFDAWQDGWFALEDIPKLVEDATWGNHWTPRSLYDLLGESGPVGSYAGWKAGQIAVIPDWMPPRFGDKTEAGQWIRDNLLANPGAQFAHDFADLSPGQLQTLADVLTEEKQKHGLMFDMILPTSAESNAFAWVERHEVLGEQHCNLTLTFAGDDEEIARRHALARSGGFVTEENYADVIRHEYGHLVLFNDPELERRAKELYEAQGKRTMMQMSRYAGESYHEMFAESYSVAGRNWMADKVLEALGL